MSTTYLGAVAVAISVCGSAAAQEAISLDEFRLFGCFSDTGAGISTIALRLTEIGAVVLPLGIPVSVDGEMASWSSAGRYFHLTGNRLLTVEEGESETARCFDLAPPIQAVASDMREHNPVQLAAMGELANEIAALGRQLAEVAVDLDRERAKAKADLDRRKPGDLETKLKSAIENNERLVKRICELDPNAQYSACDQ